MKLAILGGVVAICATTAIVAAQQAAPADQSQTIIGCLKGEGTAQSPWMLTGVVIRPGPDAAVVPAVAAPDVAAARQVRPAKAAVLRRRQLQLLLLRLPHRSTCASTAWT
jgi:hypothetical protein